MDFTALRQNARNPLCNLSKIQYLLTVKFDMDGPDTPYNS